MTLLLLLKPYHAAPTKGYSVASDAQKYGSRSGNAAATGSKASDA